MIKELVVKGAYEIHFEPIQDERGFFARLWDADVLREHGLNVDFAQCNLSVSSQADTFRGFHYQVEPYQENKLFSCIKGTGVSIVLDLRSDSPTYKQFDVVLLSIWRKNLVYVPKGCAHGFYTMVNDTRLVYWTTCEYNKAAERGVRWNDPLFSAHPNYIPEPKVISSKDKTWEDYKECSIKI